MIETLSLARAGALAASHTLPRHAHQLPTKPRAWRAALRRLALRLVGRAPAAPRGGCC